MSRFQTYVFGKDFSSQNSFSETIQLTINPKTVRIKEKMIGSSDSNDGFIIRCKELTDDPRGFFDIIANDLGSQQTDTIHRMPNYQEEGNAFYKQCNFDIFSLAGAQTDASFQIGYVLEFQE